MKYVNAEIELVRLENKDIITTSKDDETEEGDIP